MNSVRFFASRRLLITILVILAVITIPILGFVIAQGGTESGISVGKVVLFCLLVLSVLREPYLGIVITITSLPVADIVPPIPYATSAVSLLGGFTLVGYLMQCVRRRQYSSPPFSKALLWGALFIAWVLFSNPSAALLPSNNDRNWFFTFVQLWILAWLASRLLDTPHKQRVLMWVFAIATVLSAIYAIQQGVIGETLKESVRGTGLAGGANSAARYFVVGLIFLYYLRTGVRQTFWRFILLLCMGVIIFGTLDTVSRTGLILLIGAFGMLLIQGLGENRRMQAIIVFLLALVLIWFFADNVLAILRSIFPAIQQGSDTVGLRYGLWQAGWRMWQAHPIQGIGIGQYVEQLIFFGQDLLPAHRLRLGAHNMYIQVLAETGAVGLFLFLGLLVTGLRSLWRVARAQDIALASLAQTWLGVFFLMLLGGITKHDHYDKLVWLIVGVSLAPWETYIEAKRRPAN